MTRVTLNGTSSRVYETADFTIFVRAIFVLNVSVPLGDSKEHSLHLIKELGPA